MRHKVKAVTEPRICRVAVPHLERLDDFVLDPYLAIIRGMLLGRVVHVGFRVS